MAAVQIVNNPQVVDCEENFKHHDHLWIAPDGKAYIVASCMHSHWCRSHTAGREGGHGFFYTDELERAGWIHLSSRTAYCYESKMTGPAFDTLLAWCKVRERSYSQTVDNLEGRNF